MRAWVLAAAFLAAAPVGATTIDHTDIFTSFITLGDSLSDDGKADMLAPPSFEGRFSNGPVFAEYIAQDFAAAGRATVNLAIGGATAENDNETVYPSIQAAALGTFQQQAAVLNSQINLGPLGGVIGDNPLVSVLFGANDLFQDLTEGSFVGEIGQNAADAVMAGIQAVNAITPSLDSFLVVNLPDLSQTPAYAPTPLAGLAFAEWFAFNERLAINLDMLRHQGLEIIEADLNQMFADIVADPGAFGLSNVTDSCIGSFAVFDPATNCTVTPTGLDLTLAEPFLFIDSVHPNTVAHAAFADRIRDQLAPVPLPASLPLIGVGLLALGWVGRRKAG